MPKQACGGARMGRIWAADVHHPPAQPVEGGREQDIHSTEQHQNSASISPIPDQTMLGMKWSDCNFNQKFDASNLNTIIVKSLKGGVCVCVCVCD